jgi:hypothetical protein
MRVRRLLHRRLRARRRQAERAAAAIGAGPEIRSSGKGRGGGHHGHDGIVANRAHSALRAVQAGEREAGAGWRG